MDPVQKRKDMSQILAALVREAVLRTRRAALRRLVVLTITFLSAISAAVMAVPAAASSVKEEAASREWRAAVSPKAEDLQGWEASLYRGLWWREKYAGFRQCVMRRESHYRYTAKNRFSSASGAYQFLDKQWRRGLVYMMLAESRKTNDGLSEQIRSLFDQPITTWDRYFQDRAFYTAYAHGKGAAHWSETCPV